MNAGDSRTIEDMRELIRLSKFKAMNKKRIIVLDEAQQIQKAFHLL
jgi:predicted AAA+ superfamily ATPase